MLLWRLNDRIHFAGGAPTRWISVVLCSLALSGGAGAEEVGFDSPLFEAVQSGDAEEVRLLLDAGIDVNSRNAKSQTALLNAVIMGDRAEIVRLLLGGGAHVDALNENGDTPLAYAVYLGDVAVTRLLLEAGADPNKRNLDGNDPFAGAMTSMWRRADTERFLRLVRLLLDAGWDVNAQNADGLAALHYTNVLRHEKVVRLLLNAGANVNARDKDGDTVLHFLARQLDIQKDEVGVRVLHALLESGADLNTRNTAGLSALHKVVVWRCSPETARILLDAGADANVQDTRGMTPLHDAVIEGLTEIARLLLDAGADANVQDRDGETPLHRAVLLGRTEIARLLLDAGADIYAHRERGPTVLAIARARGEDYLRALGGDEGVESWGLEKRTERFSLYNACKPMQIYVQLQQSDDEKIDLTEAEVRAAAESRLRAAGLYDSDSSSTFGVHVLLLASRYANGARAGWSYTQKAYFEKSLWDAVSAEEWLAPTWERSATGYGPPNSSTRSMILDRIRGYMDEFLAEYLRVNEAACK